MVESALSVLQLNTYDDWGGAARVALNLHREYGRAGLDAKLAVKVKRGDDSGVLEVPLGAGRSLYYRAVNAVGNRLSTAISDRQRADRVSKCFRLLSEPVRAARVYSGWTDYHHPWSRNLSGSIPGRFDIVHCHNLHGGYYDLHAIANLSESYPLMLTMHDAWMLNGTLPHVDDGVDYVGGTCPDLEYVPTALRDRTLLKWKEKKEILARTRCYVTTPSRWLMERVESSIVAPSILEGRVVPNGVDHEIFKPASGSNRRASLGLEGYDFVILFVATHVKKSKWRDYDGMMNMLRQLDRRLADGNVALIALGESGADEKVGGVTIKYVPYLSNQSAVAEYYRAADLYLHLSKVDTFPTAVIEALSCGTPVVAYGVGGIKEQVRSLDCRWSSDSVDGFGEDRANGILIDKGDEESVVGAVAYLREKADLRRSLSENGVRDARDRFALGTQVQAYLEIYSEMLARHRSDSRS